MECANEGLTIWCGTPDAPMEGGDVTVGVRPAHPLNAVAIQYRVDGGYVRSAPARAVVAPPRGQGIQRDQDQYFRARLPEAPEGALVELCPVLTCGGRRVPAAARDASAGSWLSYRQPPPSVEPVTVTRPATVVRPRFTQDLEFLATVSVQLAKPPESIGVIPQGIRMNFHIESGTVAGPKLNAVVLRSGEDSLLVQRDGVAIPNVRTTWETGDGALLSGEYSGTFDLGEDGYQRVLEGRYPYLPIVYLLPRLVTSHPRYQWLNRLQCLGIGHVDMEKLVVEFDLHAVRGGKPVPTRKEGPS